MVPTPTALPVLPKPYNTPPAAGALRPGVATLNLVGSQVDALLAASPAYHELTDRDQHNLRENLIKIAAYGAELIRDDWYQSQRLGQTPMIRRKEIIEGPLKTVRPPTLTRTQAASDDLRPAAANQIGRITRETLNAVAFPTFVADLIHSTFNAITQSSVQQIEAYVRLLDNVSKTVDQFMNSSVSDAQAHAWLAEMYPSHIRLDGGRAVPQPDADERPKPDFQSDLHLGGDISLDESTIEETLVPAARRKLAQGRLQTLSTMVLMGMNRIIITGGKIRATMGFHIDTRDRAHAESATELDLRHSGQFQIGYGWIGGSASHSVAYVSSTRADSDAEINVETDLTGEVELLFKSEAFPIRRFADSGAIEHIRANTANPDENPVNDGKAANPFGEMPAPGGTVERYKSPRTKRSELKPPSLRKLGELPDVRKQAEPEKVRESLISDKYKFSPEFIPNKKAEEEKAKKDAATNEKDTSGKDEQVAVKKRDETTQQPSEDPSGDAHADAGEPTQDTT
jgi:hypothetical protein